MLPTTGRLGWSGAWAGYGGCCIKAFDSELTEELIEDCEGTRFIEV
jgi:hypothetical protein